MALRLSAGLGLGGSKHCNSDVSRLCHRLSQRLYSFEFMHGLRIEVRLSTAGARPHGDTLDNQEIRTFAKASRHVLQLNFVAAAVGASGFN